MVWKVNGYIITNQITIGDTEILLGVHETQPNMFMTCECDVKDKAKSEREYSWEHYYTTLMEAQRDFCMRGINKADFYEQHHKKSKEPKEPER